MTSLQILTRRLYDFREKLKEDTNYRESYLRLSRTYHMLLLLMDKKDRELFYQWRLASVHKEMVRAKTPRHGYRGADKKKPLPKTR